jgi:kumamolisin
MPDKNASVLLSGSFLPPAAGAAPVDPALIDPEIEISIWLRRKPDGDPLPDIDAGGLTPIGRADFAAEWGASPEDVETVMDYLEDINPEIERLPDDPAYPMEARRLLGVKGPVDSLATVFGATVTAARFPTGEIGLMRTGNISVPQPLKDIVLGVFGLDTRPIGTRGRADKGTAPKCAEKPDPPFPPDIAKLYRFPESENKAEGQVIALMQFGGGYDSQHVEDYFHELHVNPPDDIIDVGIAGGANTPGSPYDKEVTLDIEVAGSVAEEVTLVNYFAPHTERGWIEAIASAVHDVEREPFIMSISWGAPERGTSNTLTWSETGMKAMHDQFFDAACIGMTVLAACGDDGSDCRVGDWKAHVPYPASDPLVIACGGTTIEDFTQPDQEIAWERGGGGISDFFVDVPKYQDENALPISRNTLGKARGVPDIAGYADPGYGFWVGCWIVLSGTSLVAPLYAAAFARLNARDGSYAGYYHHKLYKQNAKRDIDDPVSNNTSNGLNGAPGYYGRPGWDARTGLGVVEPGT